MELVVSLQIPCKFSALCMICSRSSGKSVQYRMKMTEKNIHGAALGCMVRDLALDTQRHSEGLPTLSAYPQPNPHHH